MNLSFGALLQVSRYEVVEPIAKSEGKFPSKLERNKNRNWKVFAFGAIAKHGLCKKADAQVCVSLVGLWSQALRHEETADRAHEVHAAPTRATVLDDYPPPSWSPMVETHKPSLCLKWLYADAAPWSKDAP